MSGTPDAIVVGAGPNGLAAAIVLARAGRRVVVYEAASTVGGGCRTEALTLPGFRHDVCAAVLPLAKISPLFRALPLAEHGLEWISPPAMLAHPLDDEPAALVWRSVEETAAGLGEDGDAYRRLVGATVEEWPEIEDVVLGPFGWPAHPLTALRFAMRAVRSARDLAMARFQGARARALFAGVAAHGMLPLEDAPTAAFGLLLLTMAHEPGWILPRGGSQRVAEALAAVLRAHGGQILTDARVDAIDDLPPAPAILCDLSPEPFLRIAGHLLPRRYRSALERYRYGPAAYKVDWALDAPIPWRDETVGLAGTVHLGGTLDEIAASERATWGAVPSDRPYVLLSQPSLFDDTRAPPGKHTAWAYCHVPHASRADMLSRIEAQIERFAPGFRERVLARGVMTPADLERHNPNLVGGDIAMGVSDLAQTVARPTLRGYKTPVRGLYLCSASTPPGVGVHGMCGYYAARLALREVFR